MVRGDFTILQPEENTAPITLEESKTSMSNLFKFLVQTTAITIKDAKRVQFWDIGENNEGTNTILHTIDDPGNHHDIYHVQTEKLFIVASAMVSNWEKFEAPTHIRCDNGPAFVAELIKIICNVFGVKISVIQARQAHQNGKDTHIKPNDLVTVRMPNATRATKTTSKLPGFTKTGPFAT
eukprot:gene16844-20012_t